MSTHGEIQKFVQRHHGFIPKPEWINHVKVVWGLPTRQPPNRAGRGRRVVPLPPEKREAIEQALRHFGLKPSPAGTPRQRTRNDSRPTEKRVALKKKEQKRRARQRLSLPMRAGSILQPL